MRGQGQDCEAEVSESLLQEVEAEPKPEAQILPWRRHGNVIAAAGVALLNFARVR